MPGQARYTAGEYSDPPKFSHYECKELDDATLDRDLRKFGPVGEQMANMFKRLKF